MKKNFIMAIMIFLSFSSMVNAQSGWNWPADNVDAAKEKNVLYTDYMKQKDYVAAKEPLEWLLEKAPNLNKSLYINGTKIYEGLAKSAKKDPVKRVEYADRAMELYTKRIEIYGQKASVLNRQALNAYALYIRDKAKYEYVFNTLKAAFTENGNKIYDQNLVAYMDIARRYKKHNPEGLTDENIFEIYEVIGNVLEAKKEANVKAGKDNKKLEAKESKIDGILAGTVKIDRETIKNNLEPKFRANPSDLKMANFIFKLCYAGKCMDLPVFIDAATVLNKENPKYVFAKMIASKHKQTKNYDEAMKFYDQAISLTDDNSKKASMYIEKATVYSKRGQLSQARSQAIAAANADASMTKDAYSLIGNLYMNSFDKCKQGENKVKDRAVFLVAYDMYQKAGNSKGMKTAKSQFPSGEEIFTYNMSVGESVSVGCWINKSAMIRKRD